MEDDEERVAGEFPSLAMVLANIEVQFEDLNARLGEMQQVLNALARHFITEDVPAARN